MIIYLKKLNLKVLHYVKSITILEKIFYFHKIEFVYIRADFGFCFRISFISMSLLHEPQTTQHFIVNPNETLTASQVISEKHKIMTLVQSTPDSWTCIQ